MGYWHVGQCSIAKKGKLLVSKIVLGTSTRIRLDNQSCDSIIAFSAKQRLWF